MAKLNYFSSVEELNDDMANDVLPVTVFITIEAVVGFFGNILILLVYSRRYKRINFRYFVLALAIVDLASCCTTLPGEVFSQLNWYRYEHGWICKMKSYFNVFTAWASASILLSLAIDRYRKICHPLNWQIRFNIAFRMCGCCFLISALVATPITILWGKQTYHYDVNGDNITVSVCEKSGEYANTIYPLGYIIGVYLVPVSLIIVATMVLNFLTARKLFGQSVKSKIKKDHIPQEGTTAAMAIKSSSQDPDINEGSMTVSTNILEEDEKDIPITNTDSDISVNSSNFIVKSSETKHGKNVPHDKDTELHGSVTNHLTCPKRKTQSGVFFTDEAGGFRNSDAGSYSINEKKSCGNFSGSSRLEDSSSEHVSSDICKKQKTQKYMSYRKSKTLIMLILTSVFAVTMALYIILSSFVAKPDGILKDMPDSEKAAFFFFWRLYFINSVVNPILYGFMDARFRSGLMSYIPRKIRSVTIAS